MAFKLTFMEKVTLFISIFNDKNLTDATLSISPNKKFSDLKQYIESGRLGKSLVGMVSKQTDTGYMYVYEYVNDGKNISRNGGYRVTINHIGEKVNSLSLYVKAAAATGNAKMLLNALEKKVPDIPAGEVVEAKVEPQVDYSKKELGELVDIFDKQLNEFKKNANLVKLNELDKIKEAISDKVNLKPLAERGPFNEPIGKITTYIDALKMQMNSPLANPTQFVNMYVPQMQQALSTIAGLLA